MASGTRSTLIVDGIVEPLELGHLPHRKGTCKEYVGLHGLDRLGKKKRRCYVKDGSSQPSSPITACWALGMKHC